MSHATASRKEMCLFFLESLAAIVFDSLTRSCAASVFIHVHLFTCASIPRVAGSKGPAQTRGRGTESVPLPLHRQPEGHRECLWERVSVCAPPVAQTECQKECLWSAPHDTRRRISRMPTVLQHHNTLASVHTRALLKQLKHKDWVLIKWGMPQKIYDECLGLILFWKEGRSFQRNIALQLHIGVSLGFASRWGPCCITTSRHDTLWHL